jgi:hypothetical protein
VLVVGELHLHLTEWHTAVPEHLKFVHKTLLVLRIGVLVDDRVLDMPA